MARGHSFISQRFLRKELDDRNSLWRIPETTRNVESIEVARWIRADEPITLVHRINVGR
jgi:hypothetical protein